MPNLGKHPFIAEAWPCEQLACISGCAQSPPSRRKQGGKISPRVKAQERKMLLSFSHLLLGGDCMDKHNGSILPWPLGKVPKWTGQWDNSLTLEQLSSLPVQLNYLLGEHCTCIKQTLSGSTQAGSLDSMDFRQASLDSRSNTLKITLCILDFVFWRILSFAYCI